MWSSVVVQRGGPTWWSSVVVQRGGPVWWSSVVFQRGVPAWWYSQVVQRGGPTWWFSVVVQCGGAVWWQFRPETFIFGLFHHMNVGTDRKIINAEPNYFLSPSMIILTWLFIILLFQITRFDGWANFSSSSSCYDTYRHLAPTHTLL